MKIASHQISFESKHQLDQVHKTEENLAVGTGQSAGAWDPNHLKDGVVYHRSATETGGQADQFASFDKAAKALEKGSDRATLQALRREIPINSKPTVAATLPPTTPKSAPSFIAQTTFSDTAAPEDAGVNLETSLLKGLVEALTGKKIELYSPGKAGAPADVSPTAASDAATPTGPGEFGLRYHYSDQYAETESTQVQAQGIVITADGQKIQIALDVNLSRSFTSSQEINIQSGAGILKDPLVINFSGTAAELTRTKYSFDIDSDGTEDQISFVTAQSGFLSLDNNANGKIDNGSELFGAASGNGFADLAQYDADGNHFIDANDSVYNRLRIFSKDAQGKDQLVALGAKGIGAIYLGASQSPFDIKDENNQLLGKVRSTGLYIRENGEAGSVQQLDLVV